MNKGNALNYWMAIMSTETVQQIRQYLISTLANGEFYSGELLGQQCGVSRAAIAKHIKYLITMGLEIFSVTGKGYRLAKPLNLLDGTQIHAKIVEQQCNNQFELHHIISSTNDNLLSQVERNLPTGYCCIAEYQTAGRGRRGRQWISPFASHIYLSMYWPLKRGMAEAMGLSMVTALAVSDAISIETGLTVQLKWPNDIYLSGKKLAGILIDLESQAQEFQHSVIGIGLNIDMPKDSGSQVTQPWTDLNLEASRQIDRNALIARLICQLQMRLQRHQQQGMAELLTQWHQQDIFLDRPVRLITGNQQTQGIYRGINEQGALLLEVGQQIKPYFGGEVSLRAE
jgi:BirA family transcriptional regulator, biotin operon repressor / biotin---[acetyl-CoA-carboxylase] ligase